MDNQSGFSLLGIIIAIFIISIGLTAILTLSNFSVRAAAVSKDKAIASFLAQEGVEAVRFMRESQVDWNGWYGSIGNGSYCVQYNSGLLGFADTPLLIDGSGFYQYNSGTATPFYRRIILTKAPSGDSNELKVVAEIKWQDRGQWHYLVAEDRLWNWR